MYPVLIGLFAVPVALATGFIRFASVLDGAEAEFDTDFPDDPLLTT
ncbi:MAG TPA: hypothetical protein VFZ83_09740 [Acidimicrobiia bacterium]|nr:hypothetical protein [Acidimicrobiia bacterium]